MSARTLQRELLQISANLSATADAGEASEFASKLGSLEKDCLELRRSASGSWLGYHANVYYADLQPAPPGANFSQEWGLQDLSFTSLGSRGDWREFDPEQVRRYLLAERGIDDFSSFEERARTARNAFADAQSEVSSLAELMPKVLRDSHVSKLLDEFSKITAPSAREIQEAWKPHGQIMTRDTLALGQGFKTPPHVRMLSEVYSVKAAFQACLTGAQSLRKIATHLRRRGDVEEEAETGQRVFIGHGRAPDWREVKDFLQDRLSLDWDEFNRTPIAGVATTTRIAEMLKSSTFALLVLTAEDETAEGEHQARLNVVHEVGLFQGRLGFERAIVLLEEGCTEFSNIAGLGQIRFPKGRISATFEEVRRVLEREGILS